MTHLRRTKLVRFLFTLYFIKKYLYNKLIHATSLLYKNISLLIVCCKIYQIKRFLIEFNFQYYYEKKYAIIIYDFIIFGYYKCSRQL